MCFLFQPLCASIDYMNCVYFFPTPVFILSLSISSCKIVSFLCLIRGKQPSTTKWQICDSSFGTDFHLIQWKENKQINKQYQIHVYNINVKWMFFFLFSPIHHYLLFIRCCMHSITVCFYFHSRSVRSLLMRLAFLVLSSIHWFAILKCCF